MDASLTHELMNALVAGSVIGAGDMVKDHARRLMDLVRGKFHGEPRAEAVLERYPAAPELIGPLLEPYLDEYEIASDPEVSQLVREIMHHQTVTAHGDAAVAIGTLHQHVEGNASVSIGGIHHHTTPAPPQPCWDVRHARGALYTLANDSEATAYNVTITAPGAARFDPPENPDTTWTEHESRTFFCANALQQRADQIIVTYRTTPNGQVQTWRRALPPRAD